MGPVRREQTCGGIRTPATVTWPAATRARRETQRQHLPAQNVLSRAATEDSPAGTKFVHNGGNARLGESTAYHEPLRMPPTGSDVRVRRPL